MRGVMSLGHQRLFENGDRGKVDELRRFPTRPRHRHGAERAGIAGTSRIEAAIQHDAAADEGSDIEIDEIAQAARSPKTSSAPQAAVASFCR